MLNIALKFQSEHNDVLSRLYTSYDQLEYFCLPIAELDYFDLSPTPPINQHFDLMAGEVANGFVGERFSKKTASHSRTPFAYP